MTKSKQKVSTVSVELSPVEVNLITTLLHQAQGDEQSMRVVIALLDRLEALADDSQTSPTTL